MQIRSIIILRFPILCFVVYYLQRFAQEDVWQAEWYVFVRESKSADTDSISHAYQNLCMTEQRKEPANSAITSKPSIQNSPISSRLLLNVLGVDSLDSNLHTQAQLYLIQEHSQKDTKNLRLSVCYLYFQRYM